MGARRGLDAVRAWGGLSGAAAWGARGRGLAIALFVVQLVLNLAWTPVFFAFHRILAAQVLLVAVPELSLMAAAGRLSDHPMYEEIAEDLKIPLHAKGWSSVLAQERLRSDQIHANAAGYAEFAQGLVGTLRQTGLLAQ